MAAQRGEAPFLVLRDGEDRQVIVPLGGERLTVGRREGNDLALSWDEEVSRLHAELEQVGGEWTVVDDGLSRNGSWVNGERVQGRRRLRNGDELRFGDTVIAFCRPGTDESQPTVGASPRISVADLPETRRKVLVALCRPFRDSSFATPATNQAIAAEVFLSVDAVKTHLRALFAAFGLEDLPQNEKRSRLAWEALRLGVVSPRDL